MSLGPASFSNCGRPFDGPFDRNALQIAALKKGQILAVSGGTGLLAQYAIAAAKRQGIKVIADALPADAEVVRGYGADIVLPSYRFDQ
jgi:NADPH:quinone reductase